MGEILDGRLSCPSPPQQIRQTHVPSPNEALLMIDYNAARAVALVVETGSFEKAARALHVTPSAISQRVRALEERLGTVLVVRASPCTATEAGAWLCRHMAHVGLLERALMAQLPGIAAPRQAALAIAVNADSLGTWFLPAAAAFAQETGVLLDIATDDEEHTADWLRGGRVLAAVTARAEPVPGCLVRPLGALRYRAVASPDYLARHFPQGVSAEALAHAPALTFNRKDRLQQDWIRATFAAEVTPPTHWLPSTEGFVAAALAGMGWGLNPEALVAGPLAAGRLVELVPGAGLDRPLFWQVNRLAAGPLAALTAAVRAAAPGA